MVRKHQIDAAAVDVELLAEMLPRHRRAFDMPARTALDLDARRRRPRGLPRLRRFPKHKIGGSALLVRDILAGALDHPVPLPFFPPAPPPPNPISPVSP